MAQVLGSCTRTDRQQKENIPDSNKNGDNFILQQLDSLPPSKKLLKFYQDQLSKYDVQDSYILKKIQHVTHVLDKSAKLRGELEIRDLIIEDLKSQLVKKDIEPPVYARSSSRKETGENVKFTSASDETEYLKEQIVQQETCHKKALDKEKTKVRKMEKQWQKDRLEMQLRMNEQHETIKSLNKTVQDVSEKLLKERQEHRTSENMWINEKAKLMRKVDYMEKFGSGSGGGGVNANQRLQERVSTEKALTSEIQRLSQEIEDRDTATKKLYENVCTLEKTNSELKLELQSKSDSFAASTSKYKQENQCLKQRLDKLELRRRRDNEGYEYDIKALRKEVKSLEGKVLSIAASKQQEIESEQIIQDIRQELAKRKNEKKPWVS